jgi:TolB-like protein/Tfp pilus assembly protein PilF
METDLHTRDGVIMGTAPYMSPEQVSAQAVDLRTDIFSLGVMLYEMASGQRPFVGGSTAELSSAIVRDTPPSLTTVRSDMPEGLMQVVAQCLEKEPEDRIQNMRDVHTALQDQTARGEDRPGQRKQGTRPRSRMLKIAAGVAALAIVSFVLVRFGVFGPGGSGEQVSAGPEIRSIAVLPLDNYSGDPNQDYFAEGMTDALTADLARISAIRVISRGSAMQFGGDTRPSTPEIAEALGVDAIIEGSVHRAGDRVRITAQLIDARTDRNLWGETFERSSEDVLELQDDLASAIAGEINAQLGPAEQSRRGSPQTVNPDAYDAYLKGRYFFNRPSDENLQKAIARFEDALALDPNFVPALSGLSDAYLWAGYNEGFMTASESRPRARAAAEKAIRLDERSAEAHASLANFKLWYEYDWEGSERAFRRAIELNPNYAFAHDQWAIGLAFLGRYDESIAASRRAAELDPLNPQIPLDGLIGVCWSGDHEAARELARRAAELDPTYFFPGWSLGWIEIQAGNLEDAIPPLKRSKNMGSPAFVSAWLAYAYGASGDRDRALAEVEDLTKMSLNGVVTPFDKALVALGLGEYGRAVSLLEQAYALDSEWLGWLKNDRAFDPLRSDPRFGVLLKKLNFEE